MIRDPFENNLELFPRTINSRFLFFETCNKQDVLQFGYSIFSFVKNNHKLTCINSDLILVYFKESDYIWVGREIIGTDDQLELFQNYLLNICSEKNSNVSDGSLHLEIPFIYDCLNMPVISKVSSFEYGINCLSFDFEMLKEFEFKNNKINKNVVLFKLKKVEEEYKIEVTYFIDK